MRLFLTAALFAAPLSIAAAAAAQPPVLPNSLWTGAYRASGNEPFWTVLVTDKRVTLQRPAVRDRVYRIVSDKRTNASRSVRAGPLRIEIERRLCFDDMSGLPRPDTVKTVIEGRPVQGCGGDPRITIADEEWTVTAIDGKPPVGGKPPTLRFGMDDRASGHAGCNRWTASYAITGDGLRFGPAAVTRMACVGPGAETEARFLKALRGATMFRPADDGTLTLEGTGGVIAAKREQ